MKMDLKNLDRICMAAGSIFVIACTVLLFTKGFENRRAVQREFRAHENVMNEIGSADARLKELKKALASRKAEAASLKGRVTESDDIGTFLKDLDVLIKKRKIALNTLQPQAPVREKTYVRIPIRVLVSGPYLSIQDMLRDLDSMERLIETEKINISKAGTEKFCRAEMVISIFQHL